MTRLAGSSKLLRAMNESAALAHLLQPGGLTRADLRKLTALSTPTISEVLRRLTEAGLIRVAGHNSGRPGPNAEIYAADPDAAYAAAVSLRDIGASRAPSVTAALCDLTGVVRARISTRVDFLTTDPQTAVVDAVAALRAASGVPADRIRHVQLGVAGSYDLRAGTIRHVDIPGFARPGLVPQIAAALGTRVGVDNDVNLAAVAERRRGAGRQADGFVLLWLGDDGLGLAIDLDGTVLRGARGGAGEIGYMPLYAPGTPQRKVDLQDLIGGPAVLALGREHGLPGNTPVEVAAAAAVSSAGSAAGTGVGPRADGNVGPRGGFGIGSGTGIGTGIGSGTGVGSGAGIGSGTGIGSGAGFLAELADRISIGLAAVIAVLDPSLVVLAGPVAQAAGEPLLAAVTAAVRRNVPLESTIAASALDGDAVLLGALDAGLAEVHDGLIAAIRDSHA